MGERKTYFSPLKAVHVPVPTRYRECRIRHISPHRATQHHRRASRRRDTLGSIYLQVLLTEKEQTLGFLAYRGLLRLVVVEAAAG